MDAIVAKSPRNSRWTREAVIDDGRAVVVYPTDRDFEIFKLLIRYRYLPSDYIHAFVGGSMSALSRRLNYLSRKPNLYLARPHQQRGAADANYRHLIYELDERGSRVLKERGLSFVRKSYHRNFAHELMVAQIMASFELGTRERTNIRLIAWPEILASSNTPEATRWSPTAAAIPVRFAVNGEQHSLHVNADARPFGLERVIDGSRTYLFFPGVEADCGTEPIEAGSFERSSIAKKFAAYIAIAEQGVYRSHFGFPNFFVPLIASASVRMESMMTLLLRITGGCGSKMFLFKAVPVFPSVEKPPKAGGHMLTEPWLRAGFEPFHLSK
jgi:protein involved in plasmid replication-relaxation